MVIDYDIAKLAKEEFKKYLVVNNIDYNKIGLTTSGAEWLITLNILHERDIEKLPKTFNEVRISVDNFDMSSALSKYENRHF